MVLTKDGSGDGVSPPGEKETGTIPPTATEIEATTIPPPQKMAV